MKELTVFVFDNETAELEQMQASLERLFAECRVPIRLITGIVPDKIEVIEKKLIHERPEIVICDNHVGQGANNAMYGQHLIAYLKPRFPDAVFILLSKENIRKDSLDKRYPSPDIFASKLGIELPDKKYCEWLFAEITHKITRARVEKIDIDKCEGVFSRLRSKSDSSKRRPIRAEEIKSLVEQVCYTGGALRDNVIEEVRLRPLEGHAGQSGAVLTEISIRNKYGNFNVPAVMKFMDRTSAEREGHNHAKFVKWVLPYRWRVDLIGKGYTDEFGAVCYSFAHGGTGTPEALSKLISDGSHERVASVMKAVFDPNSQAWYSNIRVNERPLGVYLAQHAPYASGSEEKIKREDELVELIGTSLPDGEGELHVMAGLPVVRIGHMHICLTSIGAELAGNREITKTMECLSHGDLNSGNILVRGNSDEFCFIDFQHTGWHHRAMDFCSFEGSLRTLMHESEKRSFSQRVIDEVTAWQRMDQKRWLGAGPMALIDELRQLFLENHDGTATAVEFALSSAFHTWWLLRFANWNDYQKRRLLAFFLGTLYWLQQRDLNAS